MSKWNNDLSSTSVLSCCVWCSTLMSGLFACENQTEIPIMSSRSCRKRIYKKDGSQMWTSGHRTTIYTWMHYVLIQQSICCLFTWECFCSKTDFGSRLQESANKIYIVFGLYTMSFKGVDSIMKQHKHLKDVVHLPMAELRASQTRHGILQILAEVEDILHGPLPLRLRVCGSVMQNKRS